VISALKLGLRFRLILTASVSLLGLVLAIFMAMHAMRHQMVEDRVGKVHNLTEVALGIIQRHYDRFIAHEIDEDEAKRLALAELRSLRYGGGEYFFVDDWDCRSVLLPIKPDWEGRDFSDEVDSKGRSFVRLQRDMALQGGGTVYYDFAKPKNARPVDKVAYVLPFAPWRWFVATGVYLDDIDREIRLTLTELGLTLGGVLTVSALLTAALSRGITLPLGHLTSVIKRLAERDYALTVEGRNRQDEIGDIARAIEIFRLNGLAFDALQLELRQQEERATQEREAALAFRQDNAIRLEQASRLITVGELASSLAHELNQPLAAITNYCLGSVHLLEAGLGEPAALLEAMRKATQQAERASRIIARVRGFLRRTETRLSPLPIREVIEDTAAIIAPEAQRQRVKLLLDIPAETPAVLADRVMIEVVMLNLMRNAIQAMEQSPAARRLMKITADWDAGRVEIRVIDGGHGITEEEGDKVFAPFHSSKPDGMGMGLAICRSVLELHGGQLWMTPNPAGGTIFHFSLPCEVPNDE